jgi:hypothetical protein
MALGTFTVLTAGSSSANSGPYTTASITVTSGRATFVIFVHSDAASEQDAASVATTLGAISFAKRTTLAFDSAAANTKKVEVWWVVPGSTVTDTVVITLADDGTGCAWVIAEITGADSTPIVGTDVTNTTDSGSSVAATHGALANAANILVGVCGVGDDITDDAPSGTNWSTLGAGTTYTTPATALELATNTGGSATELTYSGAGNVARGLIVFEIAELVVAAGHPAGRRFGLSLPQNKTLGIDGVRSF